jgi:hypothetical protein
LNRDPINEKGGVNLYRFVHNDPNAHHDKFGLCCGCPKISGAKLEGSATINGRLQCAYSICTPAVNYTNRIQGNRTEEDVWIANPNDPLGYSGYCVTRTCEPYTLETWQTAGGCVTWVDSYSPKPPCRLIRRDSGPPPNTQPVLISREEHPNCYDVPRTGRTDCSAAANSHLTDLCSSLSSGTT